MWSIPFYFASNKRIYIYDDSNFIFSKSCCKMFRKSCLVQARLSPYPEWLLSCWEHAGCTGTDPSGKSLSRSTPSWQHQEWSGSSSPVSSPVSSWLQAEAVLRGWGQCGGSWWRSCTCSPRPRSSPSSVEDLSPSSANNSEFGSEEIFPKSTFNPSLK